MKKNNTTKLASLILLCSMLAAGCSLNAAKPDAAGNASASAAAAATAENASSGEAAAAATAALASMKPDEQAAYDDNDLLTAWSADKATAITLGGASATVSGEGAKAAGAVVTISAAGAYVVSGTLDNGQLVVNAPKDAVVHLVLNGASVHNESGPAIEARQADKVVVTLQEGTDNSVSDGKTYADTSEDAATAVIFSKTDLTMNGSGKLSVQGNANDGITSKDDLKLTGGSLTVKAADDGLIGRDLVAIKAGTVTVEAGGDAVKSTNDTEADKGRIVITDGTFQLQAGSDGIQAASSLLIGGGSYSIVTGGGNAASTKTHAEAFGPGGGRGGAGAQTQQAQPAEETQTSSAKGLKATGDIVVTGGTFKIDSADDAIHSNASIGIADGAFTLATGDDGIHADTALAIFGGTVHITKSYEGIESANIAISGGEIHLVASDDGVNVSGGSDETAAAGAQGRPGFGAASSGLLSITGGYLVVDAAGDGLDSNGSIAMSGGTVLVNGPTMNGNGPLDYDGDFHQTGGLLVAAGSSGMAQAPSESSSQRALLMTFPATVAAGTPVALTDSQGQAVLSFAPTKAYQSLVISTPTLKEGETYTLSTGGVLSGTAKDGLVEGGTLSNGTKVVSFPLGSTVTYVNASGVTTANSGGMGGPGGGMGGMGGPGDGMGGPGGGSRGNRGGMNGAPGGPGGSGAGGGNAAPGGSAGGSN